MVEKGEILKTDLETAEVLNTFFGNIVKNLEINQYLNFGPVINHVKDPTLRAILKYKDHQSILAIQNNCKNRMKFVYEEIDLASIEKEIHNLKMNKASQSSDIPTKIIKENVDIFAEFLWKSIKSSIKFSTFPSCLKSTDVTPIHKKVKKDKKHNYRPVSILPTLSKCLEKSMFSQISTYFDEIFSKYQYGFRKGYSSQQCILALLEKWKAAVDKGKVLEALLTDLSKAFDCLNLELLVAKLDAYGFTLPALKLVHDYLSDRKQRTRVNNSYSTWFKILFGVPQGSILGPLFLADLFYILSEIDIASYADDNTPYTSSNDVNGLIKSLEEASEKLLKWFDGNLMKSNPDKCHLLVSTNDNVKISIGNIHKENTRREKLLGIQFENKLSYDYRLSKICKKASRKLYALGRVTPYMNLSKQRLK